MHSNRRDFLRKADVEIQIYHRGDRFTHFVRPRSGTHGMGRGKNTQPIWDQPVVIYTDISQVPRGRYKAIYTDNPWRFKTWSKKGLGKSADRHYPTMTLDEIKAMPVGELAADDCVLFMWTTDPLLEKSFEVLRAWSFVYKTVGFVWVKTNRVGMGTFMSTGYWTRANPEYCLLATRGKPKRKSKSVRQLIVDRVREHSRKPARVYHDIERLVDGPYLEMFSRNTREGWDSFGNEPTKYDRKDVQ